MKIKNWKIFLESQSPISSVVDSGLIDPFLSEIKKLISSNKECHILFRGAHKESIESVEQLYDCIFKKKRRTNRSPLDTNDYVTKEIDRVSDEMFNFKLRSEAVFTTKRSIVARSYGTTYIFIPIGDYRYFWRYGVDDLWNYLDAKDWYPDQFTPFDMQEINKGVKDLVKYYNQGSSKDPLLSDITEEEIVFDCDEYLLIDVKYKEQIEEILGLQEYIDY